MSIEQNKNLAREFFDRFNANDIAGALDTMTDDATWWIAGNPEQLPAAGLYSKERIASLFYNMAGQLRGLRVEPGNRASFKELWVRKGSGVLTWRE